jgi:hypothetical protein
MEDQCRQLKRYTELEEHTKAIGQMSNTMKTTVMIQSRRDVSCQQIYWILKQWTVLLT